jgi:hypothetical protein
MNLDNDPTIIKRYTTSPAVGLAYWSTVTRDFVRDPETGKPVLVPSPERPRPVERVITLARRVQNWNAHETGSSITVNTNTA